MSLKTDRPFVIYVRKSVYKARPVCRQFRAPVYGKSKRHKVQIFVCVVVVNVKRFHTASENI